MADDVYLQNLIDAAAINRTDALITGGPYYINGTLNLHSSVSLVGVNKWQTSIISNSGIANYVKLSAGSRVSRIGFIAGVARTGGCGLYHDSGCHDVVLDELRFEGGLTPVYLNGGGTARLQNLDISNTVAGAESILVDNKGGAVLYRVMANNDPAHPPYAHLRVRDSAEMILIACDLIQARYCCLLDPGSGQAVLSFRSIGSFFDTATETGFRCAPVGGTAADISLSESWGSTAGQFGADFDALNGTIDGVDIIGHKAYNNKIGGIRGQNGVKNMNVRCSAVSGNPLGIIYDNVKGGAIQSNTIGKVANNNGNGWAIDLIGACPDVVVDGNRMPGNMAGPITSAGASGMIITPNNWT